MSREIRQPGDYCFTYSGSHAPIAEVEPGEALVVHTVDAFSNRINSPADKPSALCRYPEVNPQTGPIAVRGAERGDALRVQLHEVAPARDYAVTVLVPHFGMLTTSGNTPMLHEPLPEQVRIMPLQDGAVVVREDIRVPVDPFLGTIGVAPRLEAIHTLVPGAHGGNMDCVETKPGTTLLFPVFEPGGMLFLGDAHACQGDGEVSGVAAEIPARVTLTVEVVKDYPLQWPRFIDPDFIMVAGSGKPMEDATRIATVELVRWLVADFGFDELDAYQSLGQMIRFRVGNVVDPNYTVVAKCPRRYLPASERFARLC